MKRTSVITAAAFTVGLCGIAFAQQSGNQQSERSTAAGTIESYRVIALEGQPDGHLIVRVTPRQSASGEDRVTYIDLGPARQLRDQQVRIGSNKEIVAIGYLGQFQGIPLLVAERIDLEGRQYALGQSDQQRRAQQIHPDRDRSRPYQPQRSFQRQDRQRDTQQRALRQQRQDPSIHLVRGEVQAIRDFAIEGKNEECRLVKISDAQRPDRTWVVNLGEKSKIDKLNLQKGDRVLVQGRAARINGKPVLQATQLAEVVTLDEDLEAFQQQQQSRRNFQQRRW